MDADRYLDRIGLTDADLAPPSRTSLARLQWAHARSVPFETLSITGTPDGDYTGEPIDLDERWLYEKIVDRERGGFCYELNGAFAWLLDELGFDVRRCAARVADGDGGYGVPADHLTLLVDLDRRYLVDVGVGAPVVRQPVPVDGTVVTDPVGIEWQLVDPGRGDADYRLEYRRGAAGDQQADDEWQRRFILAETPRDLYFFAATCEYHANAPDSHFTGDPIAMRPTPSGHVSLSPRTLTRTVDGDREKREIEPAAYRDLLREEVGIRVGGG